MGRKIILPGVSFTDNSLPKILEYDQIEAPGSIFLFEPAHSMGLVTGVPGGNASVPNIMWAKAAALIGSGTQSSLAGTVADRSADSALWLVERTTKGGIHGISTQAGAQVAQGAWVGRFPDAIRDYIRANLPAHTFYFSSWRKITRPGLFSNAPQSHYHLANNTNDFLFHSASGVFVPTANSLNSPALYDKDIAAGTNKFMAGAVSAVTGAPAAAIPVDFGVGTFDAWSGANFNKAPSFVIYRVYCEDLTVSGRSFATVSALDKALFDAAFGVGGRYENDAYTDPATRP